MRVTVNVTAGTVDARSFAMADLQHELTATAEASAARTTPEPCTRTASPTSRAIRTSSRN